MEKIFLTEVKKLNEIDFINLRNLYTPILGLEAISLYQLLLDCNKLNQKTFQYNSFNYIKSVLHLSDDILDKSCKKLEAVGLLRTFEKVDNKTFLFVINKPLTPLRFKNNSFLYKELLKVITEQDFERIFFYQKETSLDKSDFREKTTKFYDLFDISKHKENASPNPQNTLNLPLNTAFNSVNEAIEALSSYRFVNYLTKKTIAPSLISTINQISAWGFANASINYMCYYSFKINDKIVANHIKTIANDLLKKNICSFNDIKLELKAALESRMHTNNLGIEHLEEKKQLIAKNKKEDKEKILDWDELNSSIGNL